VGIDAKSEEVIMGILRDLKAEGKTIFVVYHDLSKIESYFDDVIMVNKQLYGAGPVQQVIYSVAVIQCFQIQTTAIEGLGFSIKMEFIQALMNYGFLQKDFVSFVMVGIICGVIGCFIVLRGMALMGDALSHAVLPGVAFSYRLGISY